MATINTIKNYSRKEARKLVELSPSEIEQNMVVHHKDGNPLNNSIDNLCVITRKQHHSLHIKNGGIYRGKNPKRRCKKINVIDELERLLTIYNDN